MGKVGKVGSSWEKPQLFYNKSLDCLECLGLVQTIYCCNIGFNLLYLCMSISAVERERLRHINIVMVELHENNNQIYEHLIDREYEDLKSVLKEQMENLKVILDSLEDDIN